MSIWFHDIIYYPQKPDNEEVTDLFLILKKYNKKVKIDIDLLLLIC